MKKIRLIGLFLITFFTGIAFVYASPEATLTVSKSSIEVGQSVTATVTVTGTAAWNINITSAGSTSGCSQKFADADVNAKNVTKTFTVTCKSTSTGIISFTLSGDITAADGINKTISGSKSVTVIAVTPKSNNNFLKELKVNGFTISPEFNKNTLQYTVLLPNGTEKINVSATKEHGSATIKGTGEINVKEGSNEIVISVFAENGSEKRYTINATVAELDPIIVTVDGKQYVVIRKQEELPSVSSSFIATKVMINDEEVPAFHSDIVDITIVGLKDTVGEIKLFIYYKEKNEFVLFNELNFNGITFLPLDINDIPKEYEETNIIINEIEIKAFIYKDNLDFVLLYGINTINGNEGFYSYDKKENTIQRYNDSDYINLDDNIQNYIYISFALGTCFLLSLLVIIILVMKSKKSMKIIKENNNKIIE